jgi:sigma-54 dependent transcriptional regulator, acetoin dehydrogenase operon transcriptional activator AcoR
MARTTAFPADVPLIVAVDELERARTTHERFGRVCSRSASVQQVMDRARRLAAVDTAVLLQGETGSGKELFARALHESGPRRHCPFVAVNCGGLPRDVLASELFGYVDGAFTGARRSGMVGRIEAAHGGTLFLDEIADLPLDLQPYLLRVLEDGEVYPVGCNKPRTVEFRLVAACNRELRAEVNGGRFRMDLFYRISVTVLHIPPLRERKEDIPDLVERFAFDAARHHNVPVKHFTDEVLRAYAWHSWPGNLRELRNTVEAMLVLAEGDVVGAGVLPPEIAAAAPAASDEPDVGKSSGLARIERDAIGKSIRFNRGNLAEVAKDLRIARSTLYLKIRKYNLEPVLDNVRLDSELAALPAP